MKSSIQQKIIKQIYRLAEKQYRKGFQQGFYFCEQKIITQEEANKFREKGMIQNYSKVVIPLGGCHEVASDRILGEIAMPDMNELRHFLNGVDL